MSAILMSSSVTRRVIKLMTAGEKIHLLGILLLNTLVAVLDVLTILVFYSVIGEIVGAKTTELSTGLSAAIIAVALLFLRGLFGSLAGLLFAVWTQRFLSRILTGLFETCVEGDFSKLRAKSQGTLIREFQNSKFIIDGFFDPLFGLSREAITTLGVLLAMVSLNFQFSITTFTLIGFLGIVVTRTISSRLSFFGEQRNESQAEINDLVSEVHLGAKETRL